MLDKVCATCANRFLECVGNVHGVSGIESTVVESATKIYIAQMT